MNKSKNRLLSILFILFLTLIVLLSLPMPSTNGVSVVQSKGLPHTYISNGWEKYKPTTTTGSTTTTTIFIDPVFTFAPEELPRDVGGPAHEAIGGCIRKYESGGLVDTDGSNSSIGGYYEIIPSTWANYKGYEIAQDSPRWVQDERFNQLWAENGHAHWAAQRGRCF